MPALPAVAHSSPMDESEEQALRYCSGYVLQKLMKKYKRMTSSKTAQQFCEVLTSWNVPVEDEGESVIEFTSLWLEMQNRGGLFHIDNNVYTFFKSLEVVVRSHVHKENIDVFKQSDIQVALFTRIQESHSVWINWNNICSSLPEQGKLKLFEEVVKCFLKMRCEAFLRVYVMIRKAIENSSKERRKKSKKRAK
ncbi:hypothetical protein HOLleu_43989 [Holothuria leucospilota]|uniref:Uncharacterized protein n=1 Tax=Holothuria leucospilota TaxID=206669 RepID=A0A9Q1BAQ3_HOLLE|nr:hypothetical protein HOLleu_43989 [Holothuria leucospilota]